MKTRNNSSKAFHNNEPLSTKLKSFSHLVDKITSKIDNLKDQKSAINAFKEIIQRCYNNKHQQQQLCQVLNIPFLPGPVSLNSVPYSFFQQQYLTTQDIETSVMNQVNYLFEYLKKTKEYFYCWIIYYNQDLKLLTIKMMKKYQLKENIELLNSKYCMIGIFVDRQVNLASKKQSKISFTKTILKQTQKLSAFSCYDQPTNNLMQKQKKSNNKPKKIIEKIKNSESIYSLKSIKSASKTNSSSFKNEKSKNQSEIQSVDNKLSQVLSVLKNQKAKNFKKKKASIILFAETKFGKSVSNKFQAINNPIKVMKSLQKISFQEVLQNPNLFKSKQKKTLFRSISNTQKTKKYQKSSQFIVSNKLQATKFKKPSKQTKNMQSCKKSPLIKNRRLSKNSKIYSSCGSLNITYDSKNIFSKQHEQKIPSNLIKRKISSNVSNFKKKKINPIKFQTSSKSSFEIE